MSISPIPVEEDVSALQDIVNPIDIGAPQPDKVVALGRLSDINESVIDRMARGIDTALQLEFASEWNRKLPESIRAKANRPDTKKSKPWFDVEHIRDSIRFRSSIALFEHVLAIRDLLLDAGFKFVKIDTGKFFKPKMLGWRVVAIDMRFPNDQLVEFYMTFFEVMQNHCHDIHEKWRNTTETERMDRHEEYQRDIERSRTRLTAAWNAALSRQGLSVDTAKARWEGIAANMRNMPDRQSAPDA